MPHPERAGGAIAPRSLAPHDEARRWATSARGGVAHRAIMGVRPGRMLQAGQRLALQVFFFARAGVCVCVCERDTLLCALLPRTREASRCHAVNASVCTSE